MSKNKSVEIMTRREAQVSEETKEPTQSIPDGGAVLFYIRDRLTELTDDLELEWNEDAIRHLEGMEATVQCLTTFTDLGNPEGEYYDIIFDGHTTMEGVSGYHLEYTGIMGREIQENTPITVERWLDAKPFVEKMIDLKGKIKSIEDSTIKLMIYPIDPSEPAIGLDSLPDPVVETIRETLLQGYRADLGDMQEALDSI